MLPSDPRRVWRAGTPPLSRLRADPPPCPRASAPVDPHATSPLGRRDPDLPRSAGPMSFHVGIVATAVHQWLVLAGWCAAGFIDHPHS
jgi:hypothetical protein